VSFMESIRTCLSKYVTFSGRAQRSEFWWWILAIFGANWILAFLDSALFGTVTTYGAPGQVGFDASTSTPVFSGIFGLLTFLPSISVAVRRLHDTNRSGWWWWIILIPLIGWVILVVWYATRGTEGANDFGADPLGGGNRDDMPNDPGLRRSSIPPVRK
jgi:uncharacterized membrane protein YhaH (DUF805 family)